MKKIKLSFKNSKEVLSRNELKSIVGGFTSGSGNGPVPCTATSQQHCVTTKGEDGYCGYCNGIFGCIRNGVKCA